MSGTPSPVDEPPGKDGVQAPNPPDLKPIPEWGPGENPVGTNPPVPTPDTGTTLPPGTTPGVVVGEEEPPVVDDPEALANEKKAADAKAKAEREAARDKDKPDDPAFGGANRRR